jgi:protease II
VFSASHRFLAFGYDLHNDENLRWMIKDMEKNRIYAVKGWENNELPFVDDVVWRGDEGLYYVKTKDHRPN